MNSELRINKTQPMKSKLFLFAIIVLAVSCGTPDKNAQLEKKKGELDKLKKEKSDLDTKIDSLEAQITRMGGDSVKGKTLEVVATPIAPQIFKTYIEVQGRIDADENVSLSTEMPGTITQINVKVGDEVSKGQVLAETDARATQQQISDLQTNLDLATQVFNKQKNLWEQKIGTEIQYLQSKANKESLEKKMSALQEQVRMSKIISPISGTVDAVNIKIGQMVAPGLAAISVINFSNLKVKADVAEAYATRVKKGNEVLIDFPDMNDSITAKINYSSRAISPLTRTFGVEVLLDNNKDYHPNMVAKLKINDYQSPTPEVVIPVKYIQRGTTENYVYLADNGKVVKKAITLGREYNGMAEVLSGLKAGDPLITAGYDLVNEGDLVSVKK
jgi:RND family efflux transporter MFP subunit